MNVVILLDTARLNPHWGFNLHDILSFPSFPSA